MSARSDDVGLAEAGLDELRALRTRLTAAVEKDRWETAQGLAGQLEGVVMRALSRTPPAAEGFSNLVSEIRASASAVEDAQVRASGRQAEVRQTLKNRHQRRALQTAYHAPSC